MRYIHRTLGKSFENFPTNKAILIFGARQVGKTTLLRHLLQNKHCRWFSGDNPAQVHMLSNLPSKEDVRDLIGNYECIVIDEAQKVPGIGLLIKRLVDLQTNCRIFVTGSSSLDLSEGIYESAAGRTRSYDLWSLTFKELADNSSVLDEKMSLGRRLVYGSYPEIVKAPQEAAINLKNIYQNLAFKDIFALTGIRQPTAFIRLVTVLAYRIGTLCTYESLARECQLTGPTVANYISLLENCFLIKCLPSYSKRLTNELKKSKKIYFYDLGLRNAIINDFTPLESRNSDEQGALFENYFVIERLKQASYKNPFVNYYFWRTKEQQEVDLIEEYNGRIRAFGIKFSRKDVKASSSFVRAYPNAEFFVANQSNFYQYLTNWDVPVEP